MSAASIPYAGSKISLISKSDIRYVGTLHSINQQDSTVSLEQGNILNINNIYIYNKYKIKKIKEKNN